MQIDQPPTPPIETAAEPSPAGEKVSGAPIVDMREHFERLSKCTPSDPAAERAFIDSKIEMIRKDPHMSEAEKAAAIDEVTKRR